MSWWCQRTTSEGGDCDVEVKPGIWDNHREPLYIYKVYMGLIIKSMVVSGSPKKVGSVA